MTLDKFDPNPILVNVNKLKPYEFLDEKAQTTDWPKPVYWDRQKDIEMNDKEDEHLDKSMFMVQCYQTMELLCNRWLMFLWRSNLMKNI